MIDGFNQSFNTPASKSKFLRIHNENKVLAQRLSTLPATVSFSKNDKDYKRNQQYKTQCSHFGNDSAFKRVFSGFGYEGHHHGHGESNYKARKMSHQVDLN